MSSDYFQQKVAILFTFVDKAAFNAVITLQDNIAHCQLTVQERFDRFASQSSAKGGFSG